MADTSKTVFLSYRRALSEFQTHAIATSLKSAGYDVFVDVSDLGSGEFPQEILNQIESRAHFLSILSPGSLKGTLAKGDWLRKEIEHAIECKRNVVPVMFEEFDFDDEFKKFGNHKVPEKLRRLSKFNGVPVPSGWLEEAVERLIKRFLTTKAAAPVYQRTIAPTPKNVSSPTLISLPKWDWSKHRKIKLDAPKLQEPVEGTHLHKLSWSSVKLADKYVLEKTEGYLFSDTEIIYEGPATKFDVVDALLGRHVILHMFRVKAIGGSFSDSSEWSNSVMIARPIYSSASGIKKQKTDTQSISGDQRLSFSPIRDIRNIGPSVPVLELTYNAKWKETLKWSGLLGTHYVLEESASDSFLLSSEAYSGAKTEIAVAELESKSPGPLEKLRSLVPVAEQRNIWAYVDPLKRYPQDRYFRVKTQQSVLGGNYSPWSNTVKVSTSPFSPKIWLSGR